MTVANGRSIATKAGIQSEAGLDQAIELLDFLLSRKGTLSVSEKKAIEYLSDLIKEYEDRQHSIPDVDPGNVLNYLLESHDMSAEALARLTHVPAFVIRGVLSGTTQLS